MKGILRKFSSVPLYDTYLKPTPAKVQGIAAALPTEKCQVLNQGIGIFTLTKGSIISLQVEPGNTFKFRTGSILASTGPIETQLEGLKSINDSTSRKLQGGSFFIEQFVAKNESIVYIAPPELGDSALIHLNGTTDYVIKSRSFVFSSGDVDVSLAPNGFGLLNGSFGHSNVTGTGVLGLSAYGGIVSMKLAPGQECLIDPSNVIAWEQSLQMDTAEADSIPAFTNAAAGYIEKLAKRGVKPLFQRMIANVINFNVNIVRILVHWFRYYILGQKGYYRVTGPGELLVQTRLRPMFTLPSFGKKSQ